MWLDNILKLTCRVFCFFFFLPPYFLPCAIALLPPTSKWFKWKKPCVHCFRGAVPARGFRFVFNRPSSEEKEDEQKQEKKARAWLKEAERLGRSRRRQRGTWKEREKETHFPGRRKEEWDGRVTHSGLPHCFPAALEGVTIWHMEEAKIHVQRGIDPKSLWWEGQGTS